MLAQIKAQLFDTAGTSEQNVQLLQAASKNHVEPLQHFVNRGGGIDEVYNSDLQTLLHVASLEGATDVVSFLLRCPKLARKINARDISSRTALHLAAVMGFEVCVRLLAQANATLDAQDEFGRTPLLLSVQFEWPDTVRALMDAKADPYMKDKSGANSLDLARDCHDILPIFEHVAIHRRPSPLDSLKRCLLPHWRLGAARRDLTESSFGSAHAGSGQVQAHIFGNATVPPASAASFNHNADVEMRSGHQQGVPPPPPQRPLPLGSAEAAGLLNGSEDPLSTAIAEAAREHMRRQHAAVNSMSDITLVEPEHQSSEELQIEWHGLEPVYIGGMYPAQTSDSPTKPPPPQSTSPSHESAQPSSGFDAAPLFSVAQTAAGSGKPWNSGEQHSVCGTHSSATDHAASYSQKDDPAKTRAPSTPRDTGHEAGEGGNHGSQQRVSRQDLDDSSMSCKSSRMEAYLVPQNKVASTDDIESSSVYRLHVYFDESVGRLGFEVEWASEGAHVGKVNSGGNADQRGIIALDQIFAMNGTLTSGKGRAELLPILKVRPLLLELNRVIQVSQSGKPSLELDLTLGGDWQDHGIELAMENAGGPVIAKVRKHSSAWAAGLVDGDAIIQVNSKDVTRLAHSELVSLLQRKWLTLTVQRYPLRSSC